MLCENCNKRPAQIRITKVIGDEKIDIHLCEKCAQENTPIGYDYPFTINNFLSGMFDVMGYPFKDAKVAQPDAYKCNVCGLTFDEFKNSGKFGCAECYNVFEEKLTSIFKRLHGNVRHSGKMPKRVCGTIRAKKEVERLRSELDRCIRQEEYEKAAELRDRIRELENKG